MPDADLYAASLAFLRSIADQHGNEQAILDAVPEGGAREFDDALYGAARTIKTLAEMWVLRDAQNETGAVQ